MHVLVRNQFLILTIAAGKLVQIGRWSVHPFRSNSDGRLSLIVYSSYLLYWVTELSCLSLTALVAYAN